MLRVAFLTAAGAIALATAANAADMYRAPGSAGSFKDAYAPADSWTGFYLGVNGGYGWSASSDRFAYPPYDNGRTIVPAFGGIDPKGGFGGGQIGYNWQGVLQNPRLVLGLEADIQSADISAGGADADAPPTTWKSSVDWFGTVRGRLGYAFDGVLIYATGGFAYGDVKNSAAMPATHTRPNEIVFQSGGAATGYAAGGGVEYKIAPAWSLKGEYQYIDLGEHVPAWAGTPINHEIAGIKIGDDAFHSVRVGLNYHLGGTGAPLK